MAFIGSIKLKELLKEKGIIYPFKEDRIKNGAYELSLGEEVFLTDGKPLAVKKLKESEKVSIQPGQFALLLTEETVKIPEDKIAFISIKAGIKFQGLVNVSGFHVDPGFEGKLLFSVYNAGPSKIILSRGKEYFPIWFAEITATDDYSGSHDKQKCIPDAPVSALSQGKLASPNVLSSRIDGLKNLLIKIEWVGLALITLFIAGNVKLWTDHNDLGKAVEYGYDKKTKEISSDSIYNKMHSNINNLQIKVDSLMIVIKKINVSNKLKKDEKR